MGPSVAEEVVPTVSVTGLVVGAAVTVSAVVDSCDTVVTDRGVVDAT